MSLTPSGRPNTRPRKPASRGIRAALIIACAFAGAILLPESRAAQLKVATCQFPVTADIPANAEWIRRQIAEAHAMGADIVHFSETALSGYAGANHESMRDFPWDLHRAEMDTIIAQARELGVWIVLGAAHRLTGGNKPHNSLYVISPAGEIVDRYDKRFCTPRDLEHYTPGGHFVVFEVKGVRCGLLICYDVRFPELYRQYAKLGAQLIFHSFYNGGGEKSIHPKIMPPMGQAHAGFNSVYISMNNTTRPGAWSSRLITPDGLVENSLESGEPGVMVSVVDTGRKFYDASAEFRSDAIDGKLNNGELVSDPRSTDRTSY